MTPDAHAALPLAALIAAGCALAALFGCGAVWMHKARRVRERRRRLIERARGGR